MVVLAGCGGRDTPKLAQVDAAPLIALTHRITREGSCGQARDIPLLQRRVIALINNGRVPAELQEPLSSAANAVAELKPRCIPGRAAPPASSRRARSFEQWLKKYSG